MSKNNSSSTVITGKTAPQPAATAAQVQGKSTAGPLAGSRDPAAAAEADRFEASARDFLQNSIDIGSDDDTVRLGQALSGAGEADPDAADEQPETNAAAEEADPNEAAAAAEVSGENTVSNEAGEEATDGDPVAEAEAEAGTEADDKSGEIEDGKWPKSYLKRINKLTEKTERLAERLEEQAAEATQLREENERLKTQQPEAHSAPVAAVTDAEQSLTARIAQIEEHLEFIEANPNGATVGEQEFSPAQLRTAKRNYERELRATESDLSEMQRGRKARTEQLGQVLVTRHPWMGEKGNADRAKVDAFLNRYPALKAIPEGRVLAADAVAYQNLIAKHAARAASTTGTATNAPANAPVPAAPTRAVTPARPAARPAARPPGRPGAQPVAVGARRTNTDAAHKRFMETGDSAAGKELVASFLED